MGFGQAQVGPVLQGREKRLGAAQDDWLEEELDFIDQAEPEDSGGQVGPADRQVLAGLGFQLSDLFSGVFFDQPRVPLDLLQGGGEDDLGHGLPNSGPLERVVRGVGALIGRRPVGGHVLVHAPPVQEGADADLLVVDAGSEAFPQAWSMLSPLFLKSDGETSTNA